MALRQAIPAIMAAALCAVPARCRAQAAPAPAAQATPPSPAPGEYSVRDTAAAARQPARPRPAPGPWLPMRIAYSDDADPALSDVEAAWKATKPSPWPRSSQGTSFLYQVYQTDKVRATVMIGMTPDCIHLGTRPPPRESVVTACPARTYVVSTDRPPRVARTWGCFEYNGQSAPGSPTDPRTNSDYSQFDPEAGTIVVLAIKRGRPVAKCDAHVDLAAPADDKDRE